MIEVRYETRDRIAYLTLDRPDAKNAVTPEMHAELCRLWANFRDDDEAAIEGWNSYTCVDQHEARELLSRFFAKSDSGRAGSRSTGL